MTHERLQEIKQELRGLHVLNWLKPAVCTLPLSAVILSKVIAPISDVVLLVTSAIVSFSALACLDIYVQRRINSLARDLDNAT